VRITTTVLTVVVTLAPLATARADFPRLGIFRKKAKEDPAQRSKQLVETLKGDPDEKKRKSAAEELREHDPRTNPDIVPTLIATLQRDPSPDVRAEAAEVIGKLKPVAQPAGVALEQTLATDPAEGVRKAAQKALWDYHLNGYRSAGANPAYPQTAEPPLAKPRVVVTPPPPVVLPAQPAAVTPPPVGPRPITSGIGKGAVYSQTVEPPLAKPRPRPADPVTPPTPSLAAPPLPLEDGKPPAVPTIVPPPAAPVVPMPGVGLPTISVPSVPSAPSVPAGPSVPTIPPPA
jgi:hypothetical protein